MKIIWSGGKLYASQNKDKVPSCAGIYLVTNKEGKIQYVGQANDLQRRYAEHLYDSESNEELKKFLRTQVAKFFWYPLSLKKDRDGAELYLYNKFKPSLNDKHPEKTEELSITW